MSEQDATEPDEASAPGEEAAPEDTDADDQHLDDIAEEPPEDAESVLDDIAGQDEGITVDEALVERVEETDPEILAQELTALRQTLESLEDELNEREAKVEDLESRLKRKQAEFQNYKKRQQKRMEEEKERATEDLVSRLVDVRDNLQRALDQEEGADIRPGVESTLRQFDDELDRENVERIEPEPGDDVDPQRHEALATITSDQPEDTVAEVHRPGYEMAGKVIRTAQVAVSDGPNADE
jgi:molecular chaperone GrpE